MHIDPVINGVRAALTSQSIIGGGDPGVDAAVSLLTSALVPALRQAALDLAQQAAAEVTAQLTDRSVEVVLTDGDPTLRVIDAPAPAGDPAATEDFDARITLRLPPSLKRVIEDAATIDGDSVNAWVVDALARRATRADRRGQRVTSGFDL